MCFTSIAHSGFSRLEPSVLKIKSHLARATSGYGTSMSLAPLGLKSFSYFFRQKYSQGVILAGLVF
jgi:mevalonate kinase